MPTATNGKSRVGGNGLEEAACRKSHLSWGSRSNRGHPGSPQRAVASPSPPRKSPNSHKCPSWPGGILPTSSELPGPVWSGEVWGARRRRWGTVRTGTEHGAGDLAIQGSAGILLACGENTKASLKKDEAGECAGRWGCRRGRVPPAGPEIPRESFLTLFQFPSFVHSWLPSFTSW